MPRPSNRAARRAQIVAGLLQVMARRGYEGATVAEVARAAGLTPGLVHYHFRDKQAVLLELLEELSRRVRAREERRLGAAAAGPWPRLEAFLAAHLARGRDADPEALACWVALSAEALRQEAVRAALGAALAERARRLAGLVREALRAEGRPAGRARAIAAALLAAIQGYYQLAAVSPDLVPPASALREALAMARGLLEAGGRGRAT